jgi:transcriptional regulator with XRE-family HTH domain
MTTIDKQKFARAVKRYREEKDLTQKELAEKLMTTTTTVARWELGMSVPKQDRMIREIKALGINW